MKDSLIRWWKVFTKEEPPYEKWIPHAEWDLRDWRRFNLEIYDYKETDKKYIKVRPATRDLKAIN